jgi:hypothetical protein
LRPLTAAGSIYADEGDTPWLRRSAQRRFKHGTAALAELDDATFNRSATSFDNPDHVAIVMHIYRWRIGLAQGESRYDDLE